MQIGILVDQLESQPGYVAQTIQQLCQFAELDRLVVIPVAAETMAATEYRRHRSSAAFQMLAALERRVLPNPLANYLNRQDLRTTKPATPGISPDILDPVRIHDSEHLAKISGLDLDFLVWFCRQHDEDARSQLASLAQQGLLYFSEAANSQPIGPPGFSQVAQRQSISHVGLILVPADGGTSTLVERAAVATDFSWLRNHARMLSTIPDLLKRFWNRRRGNAPAIHGATDEDQPILNPSLCALDPAPSWARQFLYLCQLIGTVTSRKIWRPVVSKCRKLFGIHEPGYWTVKFGSRDTSPENWQSIALNPKRRWAADPFFLKHGEFTFVLFEDWDVKTKIGKISAKNINNDDPIFCVLEEPFHLSYPFTFYRHGNWFLIPESSQASSVRLYQLIFDQEQRTFRAEFLREVLPGAFVDPTIVRQNETDILFVNPRKPYAPNFNGTLDVFLADDITSDQPKIVPHPLNPIEIHPQRSRSAGRAVVLNHQTATPQLRRYSQKCDRMYGEDLIENLLMVDRHTITVLQSKRLNKNTTSRRVHHLDTIDELMVMDFYFHHGWF